MDGTLTPPRADMKEEKYPLSGPTCPYCKARIRRRRYWNIWTRVHCKCGATGELMRHDYIPKWQWMKTTPTGGLMPEP